MRRVRSTTTKTEAAAVDLRHRQSPTEATLWEALRNRNAGGLKFRRQHPAGPFILDFYCAEARLAVELDGESHENRAAYDEKRTAWLNEQGIVVLRFPNEEVVLDRDAVVRRIVEVAEARSKR
ncbi:MAG: DUF559 domain-containing protein [Thermomicrobiales bacterium]|jgi:very-short-patch-repair endonuclease|nr:DUF559 domain-containing protein [Thermomicrobiales bacterium]